ncbi:MAG: cbb3-type cytochrome oxidase assembly protein CcoS [Saprospiraceae bacterium]|nr:cbb3-type cytochrome oxidase assembly protein CcoS [Bacteroidia bacterium]NNE14690.1 cbb3-type cytochrome oxidase assembly protein CcoS [Saprospiraceae bacterium]NNL91004.1 cbb3-type cytochrome oxidase assembly protein CcoS [Saprospiraceae bacterium]
MKIIILLIAISLLIAIGFLFAFFWAVGDGQFDDDYTPSLRLLVDDDMISHPKDTNSNKNLSNEKNSHQNVAD